jgi:hypothetical protein
MRRLPAGGGLLAACAGVDALVVRGALTIDLGVERWSAGAHQAK